MATKNLVTDLTKGEKLGGNNYDKRHRKIQYLLNEQVVLETLVNTYSSSHSMSDDYKHCKIFNIIMLTRIS